MAELNESNKLRQLSKNFGQIFNFITILVAGTNCKLAEFAPNKYNMSYSERISVYSNNLPIYEPFYKILFIDMMIPTDYLPRLRNSLFRYLKARKSVETTFHYGRPLWATLLQSNNYSRQSILDFAQQKLIFSQKWEAIKENYDKFLSSLAIMSVRTTLSINYEATYGSQLISKYMSTLFYINKDLTSYAFRYFSEPILAEGKLLLLHENFNYFFKTKICF